MRAPPPGCPPRPTWISGSCGYGPACAGRARQGQSPALTPGQRRRRRCLDKLRPAHLVALDNAKSAEGLSGSSLRHIHAVIRRALNVAVRWQLIVVNPATLVDAPQARQHEVTPLPADEARRLIQAAKDDRMEARWLVGLALGSAPGRSTRAVVGRRRPEIRAASRAPGLAAATRRWARLHRPQDTAEQADDPATRSTHYRPGSAERATRKGPDHRWLAMAAESIRVYHADRNTRRTAQ